MRKLMWFTIGFGSACGLCAWLISDGLCVIGVSLVVLSICAGILSAKWKCLRSVALLFIGGAMGLFWFAHFRHLKIEPAEKLDGSIVPAVILATDYGTNTQYGIRTDGVLELKDQRIKVRIYLNEDAAIKPGDAISGEFLFRLTTPGGTGESAYHGGSGVFLMAYQKENVIISPGDSDHFRYFPVKLRRFLKDTLTSSFPQDTSGFARALLLGDTEGLDYETDTNLKISGLRHIAAVSGMHVSILFALVAMTAFHKRYLMALIGYPVLLLFAAVAGFSPSVTRACVMSGLMLLGNITDREYDGGTALSFAALCMLAINPLVITSVSFQLSCASVAGILLFSPAIQTWMRGIAGDGKGRSLKARLMRWGISSVSVSLATMPLTMPLCAIHFGTVSLVGVLTNLLTLWIISLIFYGIMLVSAAAVVTPMGAEVIAAAVSVPIRFVLRISQWAARLPFAAVYTQSIYIRCWILFCCILLLVFLFLKRKRPVLLGCCACLSLCIAVLFSWTEPMLDDTRITVLDVGQGQCILLQSEGRNFLVDCGGSDDAEAADLAAQTLLSQGVGRLDAMVLTHLDRDHAGGAEDFLSRIETELLILPAEHTQLGQGKCARIVYTNKEMEVSFGSSVLRIFPATFPGTGNEKSLCVLFDTEKCDILITGDRDGFGERMLLRNWQIPDVDVLIAGHHGAAASTCGELLQAVKPEIVCISVGKDNPYGHPAEDLLRRLNEFGCTVYRTDIHGTIIIRR